jgi:DNA-binding NtrC family response regulator
MNIQVASSNQARDERGLAAQSRQLTSESSLTILISSADDRIREQLLDLLRDYHLDALAVPSLEAAKTLLITRRIAVILSGIALDGGSYRDLLTEVKCNTLGIPLVVVSTPTSSDEYRDYLASVNSGAFDFVCHPYQKKEVERILRLALLAYARGAQASFAASV